jgi:hypothetical protein
MSWVRATQDHDVQEENRTDGGNKMQQNENMFRCVIGVIRLGRYGSSTV